MSTNIVLMSKDKLYSFLRHTVYREHISYLHAKSSRDSRPMIHREVYNVKK